MESDKVLREKEDVLELRSEDNKAEDQKDKDWILPWTSGGNQSCSLTLGNAEEAIWAVLKSIRWDWIDSTAERVLDWDIADLGSITGIPYGSLITAGINFWVQSEE